MPDPAPDYAEIARSPKFQELLTRKKQFLVPVTLFFLAFYFTLPILTSYSHVLNRPALGAISYAWIFALAQFVMTWTLCAVYTKKAAEFDALAAEAVQEGTRS